MKQGGDGMAATINDIAAYAGTSKSTVSRYLNGGSISQDVSGRIEKAIEQLDYQPNVNARRLVKSCTNVIGIVFDDISNYIYGDMMAGIQQAASRRGYSCIFLSRSQEKRESDYLSMFQSSSVDGLVCVTFGKRDAEQVRLLRDSGMPVVLVGEAAGETDVPTVDVDNMGGTMAEVRWLITQGHKRIAYLEGPDNMPAAISRRRGYLHALENAGITPDPNLIVKVGWSVKDAYKAVRELAEKEQFTALVGSNAYSTYGGLQALLDKGLRVPQDVAVAGFDDAPILQYAKPSITTLNQPLFQMGEMATEQVINRIQGKSGASCATYAMPTLVMREST